MDHEEIPSMPSTPATTPGTPGAPLFGGFDGKRSGHNGRYTPKSLLKSCKCFSVDNEWALEDGRLPLVSCALPPPNVSLYRKLGAEFVGTLILIFAGTATAIVNQKTDGAVTLIGCAASAGLAVMIVILSTGHISGAHLNPAVTISFAALKHFPWKHVPVYIGAQVLASVCAAFALKAVFEPTMSGGVTVPTVTLSQAFALEPATSASMNPVRTLGPAIAANNYRAIWVYLTAPILGALIGAGTYTVVKLPEEDEEHKEKRSFRR
ncbi:hypothetical protein Bca4012_050711 [Brassica carinata]